jgi:hypothetical protein
VKHALSATILSLAPQWALAQGLTLGTGFDYTSGKYGGTETTDQLYLPFYAKYEIGAAVFRMTVPYISVTGPGNVIGAGGDRIVVPGAGAGRRTASGLGDIVASAFYNVLDERRAGFGIDLGVKAKFGTADEKEGLGTGQNDYSVQADLFKPLGAGYTLFGSVGHRWYGDPPGFELKNVFYGAVGASYRFSGQTSIGAVYDYRPEIVPGGGEVSEATAYLSHRLGRDWKLQPYILAGFGRASPDYGVGAQIAYAY